MKILENNEIKKDLLYKLRKLNTEVRDAKYKFEELDDAREAYDILAYLINDAEETRKLLKEYIDK